MTETVNLPTRQNAPTRTRRVAVVLNGRAGALLDKPGVATELEASFATAGLTPEFVPLEAGTLTERLEQASRTAQIVVVAGGDGTIACAAQVLAGTNTVLGILPSGTMNLLAKDLGIPTDDVPGAIALIADGSARAIDMGEVNDKVFLCASMLGLPANIGRHREAHRDGGPAWRRWSRFALAALRTTRRYVARRLVLEFPREAMVSRAPSITVTVNRLDDAAGRLFARARLDGGEFAVYLAQRPGFRDIPGMILDLARGRWRAGGVIDERLTDGLVVRSHWRAIRVMNDGEEMMLRSPLQYRIRPGALRVLAPAASSAQ